MLIKHLFLKKNNMSKKKMDLNTLLDIMTMMILDH